MLSLKNIENVLNSLISSERVSHDNVLRSFILVQYILIDPTIPKVENAHEHAIQTIIVDIIVEKLRVLRTVHHLAPPDIEAVKHVATEELKQDFHLDVTSLRAWSLAYCFYVRDDLGYTINDLANLLGVVPRTLRRYRSDFTHYLKKEVLYRETLARRHHRKLTLLKQLPHLHTQAFIGREDALKKALLQVEEFFGSKLFIVGAEGIGKTTFVYRLISEQVNQDTEAIDYIVYLEKPTSAAHVMRCVYDSIGLDDSGIDVSDFFHLFRVIIIIDDVSEIASKSEIKALLKSLHNAQVILTNRSEIPYLTRYIAQQITLYGLNHKEITKLIRSQFHVPEEQALLLSAEGLHYVSDISGGNPLITLMACNDFLHDTFKNGTTHTIQNIYSSVFSRLDVNSQRMWVALAISPTDLLDLPSLEAIWCGDFEGKSLSSLYHHHILYRTTSHVEALWLSGSARIFVEHMIANNPHLREHIDNLFGQLMKCAHNNVNATIIAMAHIAHHPHIQVDPSILRQWINQIIATNYQEDRKVFKSWFDLLASYCATQYDPQDYAIQLRYVRMRRIMNSVQDINLLLERIIVDAGKAGDFPIQAEAFLELAIIQRISGDYEVSLKLLNYIDDAYTTLPFNLKQRIAYELARIALDRKRPAEAIYYLASVNMDWQMQLIQCEAFISISEFEKAEAICMQGFAAASNDEYRLSHWHTLFGRNFAAQSIYDKAYRHFLMAQIYIERVGVPAELARCWANTGMALAQINRESEGYNLLMKALRLQKVIGDSLGERITQYNLDDMHSS